VVDPKEATGLAVTQPQHMQALARANRVRLARAELKREIARGDLTVAEVLEEVPWEAESMTIGELLTSQRRWGRTRCRNFLHQVHVSDKKMLASMTPRQCDEVVALLGPPSASRTAEAPSAEPKQHQGAHWNELATLVQRQQELSTELAQLTTRRDELIRNLSEAGASRRSVAEAASLTVGRVQQIVDEHKATADRTDRPR
jgi:hypothetical protein